MTDEKTDYVEDAVVVIGRPWISAPQFLADSLGWMMGLGVKVELSLLPSAESFTVTATCWRKQNYRITCQKPSLYNALAWVVLKVDTLFNSDEPAICPICGGPAHGTQRTITGG